MTAHDPAVLLGGGQQPDRLVRTGRVGMLGGDRGGRRELGGVLRDPLPPDGVAERALDDGVDLGDGGRLGGLALVRSAPLVADVVRGAVLAPLAAPGRPVVHQAAAAAAQPTTAGQPGVQPVKQLGVLLQVADLVLAEGGPDRPLDVPLVDDARAEIKMGDLEHVVEQLPERGLVPRLPASGHVGQHPLPGGLSLFLGVGVRVAVLVALRDRVAAFGDGDLVPEWPFPDEPSGFPHGSYPGVIGTFIGEDEADYRSVISGGAALTRVTAGQRPSTSSRRRGAPGGRTLNQRIKSPLLCH